MFLTCFVNCAENRNYVPRNWSNSKNFEKSEKLSKSCHSELFKNQRCLALPEKKSALFSSESALFQRKSALFRDFQVMNSAETDLKVF